MPISTHSSAQVEQICILSGNGESFGEYLGEILKAEGIHSFCLAALSALDNPSIERYPLIILAKSELTPFQADRLRSYVNQGGSLIAFRPDRQLASLFGIVLSGETLSEGYLRIDPNSEAGSGLLPDKLQFHGSADAYALDGAVQIATLYRDTARLAGFPAVVCYQYGAGQAVAFSYNLPESVVLTRQGNPDFAGQERDGILGIRAAEMYLGWADVTRNAFNQADEQMRFLARLVESLRQKKGPLPRLWYFPQALRCLVTLTSDGEDSTQEDFEIHLRDIEARGARISLYLKAPYIPAAVVQDWVARGHEISSHYDDTAEATSPTFAGMTAVAQSAMAAHRAAYGLSPRTVRNHWIVWVGWCEQAEIEASLGIGLDCNVYHYDRESSSGHYLGCAGGFTGSGLPMKYANRAGKVLDIYQSLTQIPDEQWLEERLFPEFKAIVDRSLDEECYSFVNVNLHTDRWQVWSRKPGLEILEYARERGVPVWTAERTLDFLRARDAVKIDGLSWTEGELSFDLDNPQEADDLSLLLPERWEGKVIQGILAQDAAVAFTLVTVKGRRYALFPAGKTGAITVRYR